MSTFIFTLSQCLYYRENFSKVQNLKEILEMLFRGTLFQLTAEKSDDRVYVSASNQKRLKYSLRITKKIVMITKQFQNNF